MLTTSVNLYAIAYRSIPPQFESQVANLQSVATVTELEMPIM
jgi:hypothetical protein